MKFKTDTGADVTVMPEHMFHSVFKNYKKPVLKPVSKRLLGPGHAPLGVLRVTNLLLQKGTKQSLEEVYVISSLHTALLGRPAISSLGLVTRVDT